MSGRDPSRISQHVRSNVVGYFAVFLALSGGAYAAGLDANSVKSKQIKDGQVKTADLAAEAVTEDKVAPSTLTEAALANGAVTRSKLGTLPSAGLFGATYNETGGTFCTGTNASFPNNTVSSVEFTAEQFDTADLITPQGADCYSDIGVLPNGTYVVTASLTWAPNATGMRAITLQAGGGGSPGVSQVQAVSGGETRQSVSAIIRDPGSVTLRAYQNSGAPLAILGGNFAVAWVGP
ncbi:MAG: hypothetical protein QOI31_1417 [Solirubrobacterales bacterium]|jgi:hypothetical protein|nr:hypothetical protein [Solirubrobacterales bacterium]